MRQIASYLPGAGAELGAAALALSAPDSSTLLLGSIVDQATALHAHKARLFETQRDPLPVVGPGFGTVAVIVSTEA